MITKNSGNEFSSPLNRKILENIRHDIIWSIIGLMVVCGLVEFMAALHYKQIGLFLAAVILITGVLGSVKLPLFTCAGRSMSLNVTLIVQSSVSIVFSS